MNTDEIRARAALLVEVERLTKERDSLEKTFLACDVARMDAAEALRGWRALGEALVETGHPLADRALALLNGEASGEVSGLASPEAGHTRVNVELLRELAGALNRQQAKHPHANYVGYGDAILTALGEKPGYMGKPLAIEGGGQ